MFTEMLKLLMHFGTVKHVWPPFAATHSVHVPRVGSTMVVRIPAMKVSQSCYNIRTIRPMPAAWSRSA